MKRRDALKTLALAVGSRFGTEGWTTGAGRRRHSPEVARLARSLPAGRAHLVVTGPDMNPDAVLDPIIEVLQESGRSVRPAKPGAMPVRIDHVLVLREPGLSTRQLWVELPELDRKARRDDGTVLVSWQIRAEAEPSWLPRFRQAASWVIHVGDPEFDVPPRIIPSHYRIPVEVYDGSRRIGAFPIVETVAAAF